MMILEKTVDKDRSHSI